MKSKKYTSVLAVALVIALAPSCVRETFAPMDENVNSSMTINASIADLSTKVVFTPSYTGGKPQSMTLTWAEGDKLRIYNHADRTQYSDFTLSSGSIGQKDGLFTGTPVSASSYDVEVISESFDYAAQTQPSDGVTTDLKYQACATGLTDLHNVVFTDFSSVLAVTVKMPTSAVAGTVKSVDITAGSNIFNGGNTLKITFSTPGDADNDGILHFFATLPMGDQPLAKGTTLLVHLNAPGAAQDVYTRFLELPAAKTFTHNDLNTININATNSPSYANTSTTGIGSVDNPYLIGDKYQMQAMYNLMESGKTKYFKMVDDVDLNGVAWAPLNTAGEYDKGINFNGNGKTISKLSSTGKYASFFGVLYGAAYNVTFDAATIETDQTNSGVVAGYLGTGTGVIKGTCYDITVKNSTLTSTSTKGYFGGIVGRVANPGADIDNCKVVKTTITAAGPYTGSIIGAMMSSAYNVTNCSAASDVTVTATGIQHIGGLIGRITEACTVEKCSFSGSVTGGHDVGGIVGSSANVAVVIRNCFTSGTVAGGDGYQRCGGLVGELGANGSVISCYSTASVSSSRVCGGIVGRACSGGWTTTSQSGNSISNCIAFNSAVTASAKGNYGSSGAVVGFTSCKNTLSNCYRLYNMTYSNSNNTTEYITTMVDQPNCDGTNWTLGTTIGTSAPNQCPYYGVAAASSATVSSVAQSLGWDGNIWDFSTDIPTLK